MSEGTCGCHHYDRTAVVVKKQRGATTTKENNTKKAVSMYVYMLQFYHVLTFQL